MSIEKKQIRWIEKIAKRALSVLNLNMSINMRLEPIGRRFATEDNSCEVCGNTLYVNSDWLKRVVYGETRMRPRCIQRAQEIAAQMNS